MKWRKVWFDDRSGWWWMADFKFGELCVEGSFLTHPDKQWVARWWHPKMVDDVAIAYAATAAGAKRAGVAAIAKIAADIAESLT